MGEGSAFGQKALSSERYSGGRAVRVPTIIVPTGRRARVTREGHGGVDRSPFLNTLKDRVRRDEARARGGRGTRAAIGRRPNSGLGSREKRPARFRDAPFLENRAVLVSRRGARADLQPAWPPPDEGSHVFALFQRPHFDVISDSLLVVQIQYFGRMPRRFTNVDPQLASQRRPQVLQAPFGFSPSPKGTRQCSPHPRARRASHPTPGCAPRRYTSRARSHVRASPLLPARSAPASGARGSSRPRLASSIPRRVAPPSPAAASCRGTKPRRSSVWSAFGDTAFRTRPHRVRRGDRDPGSASRGEDPPTALHRRSSSEAFTRERFCRARDPKK